MAESPDGETPVIVGMADAAMHMYRAAIEALPDNADPEYPERAAVVLAGLRKLQQSLAEAASRSRATPSVIVALSSVRSSYDKLMADAAAGPYATVGQRLYIARQHAKLSSQEAANAVGLRADLIESVEAGDPATRSEEAKIAELLAGLDGGPMPPAAKPPSKPKKSAPVEEQITQEPPAPQPEPEPQADPEPSAEPEHAQGQPEHAEQPA